MIKKLFFGLVLIIFILSACAPTQDETEEPTQEPSGAFELFLVASPQMSGADLDNYDLDELPLAEEPILSTEDIVNYLWDEHMINVSEEAYKKLLAIFSQGIPMSGVPFVIVSNDVRIYAGAFWSPASSLPFDGVMIRQPFDPAGAPLIISLGYPTSEFFTGEDPRSDQRLKQALQEAGLIQ